MKKKLIIVFCIVFIICGNAFAWDIGTYPRQSEMQNNVYHWFMDYAILVDTSPTSSDTPERIAFAKDVVAGRINYNTISVSCATNATIRAKIIASDLSYVNDLEYVIATEYESGTGIPLFTILAEKLNTNN
jgi:hypothetical protein